METHCKQVVIRDKSGQQHKTYKTLLESVTPITSKIECAELCYNKTECRGSMLYSTTCLLYRKAHCPCSSVSESISPDLPSRYKILKADVGETWQDMSDTCQQQGMHLLAVNSQAEQDAIVRYVKDSFRKYSVFPVLSKVKYEFAFSRNYICIHTLVVSFVWLFRILNIYRTIHKTFLLPLILSVWLNHCHIRIFSELLCQITFSFLSETETFVGCYKDKSSDRALPLRHPNSNLLTNQMCALLCHSSVSITLTFSILNPPPLFLSSLLCRKALCFSPHHSVCLSVCMCMCVCLSSRL